MARGAARARRRFRRAPRRRRRRPRHGSISVGAVRWSQSAGGLNCMSSTTPICALQRVERSRPAAVALEDEPEKHEPEIAVDRLRARCVLERHGADRAFELLAPAVLAEQAASTREGPNSEQEVPDGDVARDRRLSSGRCVCRRDRRVRWHRARPAASTSGVVASTLVSEARSKIVSSPAADVGASNVRPPKPRATAGCDASPTSTTAAGNARWTARRARLRRVNWNPTIDDCRNVRPSARGDTECQAHALAAVRLRTYR